MCEKQQAKEGKVIRNVPGLLISMLRHYKTNGPPTIPAGVHQYLIPPSLVDNFLFIDFLSRAKNPHVINAALIDLDNMNRSKGFRGNNYFGVFLGMCQDYQKIEQQPLPME